MYCPIWQKLWRLSIAERQQLIISLLNTKTKEIKFENDDYPGYWDIDNDNCCLATFVKTISTLAPNLETLLVYNLNNEQIISPFALVTKPLEKLKTLKFNCWRWSDPDLNLLTPMVPNLEELMVN
jgi:hypothetical protein